MRMRTNTISMATWVIVGVIVVAPWTAVAAAPQTNPPDPKAPRPASPTQPAPPTPPGQQAEPQPPPDPPRVEEHVEVTRRLSEVDADATVYRLDPLKMREAAGGFENVFQVLDLLPGIAATDDGGGKLAVRGAGPEHNLIIVDGVQIHHPHRLGEFTSSLLNPTTVSSVAVDASGLDARHGARLSSVTIVETRDGRRDRRLAMSGSLGLTSGDVLFEGRLPKSESGSWWAGARGTYYQALIGQFDETVPGFADGQFKVSLQPGKQTRLTIFGLIGRERLAEKEGMFLGQPTGFEGYEGTSRLASMNLWWTPRPRLAAVTTISAYDRDALDREHTRVLDAELFEREDTTQDVAVRQRLVFGLSPRHVFEGGVEAHRLRTSFRMTGIKQVEFPRGLGPTTFGDNLDYAGGRIDTEVARSQVGFWVQDRIPLASALSIEPGVRVDWNSFTGESALQPRVRLTGRVRDTTWWTGFSAQAQTPSHESLQGFDYFHITEADGDRLRNERSRQIVAGLERALRGGFALRVEAYHRWFDRLLVQRLETDAERARRLERYDLPPDLPPDDVTLEHRPTVTPDSVGEGKASGVEVLLERWSGARLNGWLSYTFSKATREMYGFEFPFDFDRSHALAAALTWQISPRVRLAGSWRFASGFPVTPLHEEVRFGQTVNLDGTVDPILRFGRGPDGSLSRGYNPSMRRLSLRNGERLSGYSRTDIRATFATLGHWEFYGEVLNLFKQRNYIQRIDFPPTADSPGFQGGNNVHAEYEWLPSFGVRVKF